MESEHLRALSRLTKEKERTQAVPKQRQKAEPKERIPIRVFRDALLSAAICSCTAAMGASNAEADCELVSKALAAWSRMTYSLTLLSRMLLVIAFNLAASGYTNVRYR